MPLRIPQLTFCVPAYPRRDPSAAPRTHAPAASIAPRTSTVPQHQRLLSHRVPTHLRLQSCCVPLLCLCTEPSITPCTSTLGLFLRCVSPHCAFFCSAYPRTAPFSVLRTPALAPLITCEPLIRAKLAVHRCVTDSQIHRSDQALERSQLINRFAFQFHLDLDLAFKPITQYFRS